MNLEKLNILGIPVNKLTADEAQQAFECLMSGPGLSQIVTPNSEILAIADKDPQLKEIICKADLVIPDGIGLVYASRMLGSPLKERVTGIDFTRRALGWCAENGKAIYFIGSKPGIAEKAAEKLRTEMPDINIVGCRDGYFKPEEENAIVEEINASGAEFLCVALGAPKQELFISKYKDRLVNVKAAVGIGGSFDVWSGTVKRAPEGFQKLGLEWLYRIVKEPKRLKRSGALPLFLIKVAIRKGN